MRLLTIAFVVLLLLDGNVHAAEPSVLGEMNTSGKVPADFVPPGWTIESTHEGDLTKDGIADVVLVLIQQAPAKDGESRERALVVLAREADKTTLRLLGRNDKLLLCDQCGGVKGGTGEPTITVEKGVLVINSSGGSREMWSWTFRFRMDAKSGKLVLIGRDMSSTDTLTMASQGTSENYLTGQAVRESNPPDAAMLEQAGDKDAAKKARSMKPKKERYKVDKKMPRLEEVAQP